MVDNVVVLGENFFTRTSRILGGDSGGSVLWLPRNPTPGFPRGHAE